MVALTLDGRGFIRKVGPAEGDAGNFPRSDGGKSPTSRNIAITRLAVLEAAAEWSAGRAEIKSGDVLKVAERWVLREGDES